MHSLNGILLWLAFSGNPIGTKRWYISFIFPRSFSNGKFDKASVEAMRERRMSQYEGKTAAMPLCIFNLMNAILGSGILGLANAVANLGIALFSWVKLYDQLNEIYFILSNCLRWNNYSYRIKLRKRERIIISLSIS